MNDFEEKKTPDESSFSDPAIDGSDDGFAIKEASFKKKKKNKKKNKAEKNKKRAEHGFFSFKDHGVILSFLFMLVEKISTGLKYGFFGKIFSSLYSTEDKMLKEGFLGKVILPRKRDDSNKKPKFRTRVASLYEKSFFYKWISEFLKWLAHSYVRLWGVLLVSFGSMLEVVAAMRYYIIDGVRLDEHLWGGFVLIILSFPLLSSARRLGETLVSGVVTGYLLVDFLGFDKEKFRSDDTRFGGYYSIVFLIGSLCGLLSYFVSPLMFVELALVFVVFAIIMSFPEIGMMLTFGFLPFTGIFENPSLVIMMLVLFVFTGFAFKFIRGKRVVRFETTDLFVGVFAILLFFGGVVSVGKRASLNSSLLYCGFILAYFLIVNMLRKKQWIYRSVKLIIFSTSIIAVIGIFEQGVSVINPSWVDLSMFADIGTRVTSLFDNPNMLSIYLIIVFPFVLSSIATAKNFRERLLYLLCAFAIVLCTVYTWSRGAWLGIMVATAVFLVAYNMKNIWVLLLTLISLPVWTMFLPQSVINRAMSIGSITDSSSFYRIYTWKGVFNMIKDYFFTGIGVGESAFSEIYPIYSYSGTETVMHSHNLFIEITVQLGIVGLLVLLIILFFYAQKCLETIKVREKTDARVRSTVVAGFSSIIGALTMGLTDHIWYNYRVFLLFWSVIALTCALIRINNNALDREKMNMTNNNQYASLDIEI